MLGIGFFMIKFTERKHGLHEMIVSTYVFYKCGQLFPINPNQYIYFDYQEISSMPKFCPTCGKPLQFENAEICPNCGVRIKEPPKPVGETYAGFWIRFGAHFIDGVILTIMSIVISLCMILFMVIGNTSSSNFPSINPVITLYYIIYFIIIWLYYAAQESSSKQATLGKQVFGLIVTDNEGNRLSFGRATGR
jgi:hypothetical protein